MELGEEVCPGAQGQDPPLRHRDVNIISADNLSLTIWSVSVYKNSKD